MAYVLYIQYLKSVSMFSNNIIVIIIICMSFLAKQSKPPSLIMLNHDSSGN